MSSDSTREFSGAKGKKTAPSKISRYINQGSNAISKLDMYGSHFHMYLASGNKTYKTCLGGFLTVVSFIFVIYFTAVKTWHVYGLQPSNVITYTRHDQLLSIGGDSGFAFAAAIVGTDPGSTTEGDWSKYGQMVYHYSVTNKTDGKYA